MYKYESQRKAKKAYYERQKKKGIRPRTYIVPDEIDAVIKKFIKAWKNKQAIENKEK